MFECQETELLPELECQRVFVLQPGSVCRQGPGLPPEWELRRGLLWQLDWEFLPE